MNNEKNVLICVTRQVTCERLIKEGSKITLKNGGKLYVIHVAKIGDNFLGNPLEGEALDYLFDVSKKVGAEMTVIRSNSIVETLVDFVQNNSIQAMVVGESPDSKDESNIINVLKKRIPNIYLIVIPA